LSLKEALALAQQTQIQLASTGLAKEDKKTFASISHAFKALFVGFRQALMALSILDDNMTFWFMILTIVKIRISSQSAANLKAF